MPRLNPAMRAGFRDGLPFAVAAFVLAISFGVLAEPLLGAEAAIAMSVFVFAGSAQFGATAVLASGGGPAAAILAGVLLNARYVPMGIALAPSLEGGPLRRALYGQAMIDASWASANRGGGRFDADYLVGFTLPDIPLWIGGTAIGAYAGDLLGDPEALGLDAMFPAFFLALLANELRNGRARGAAAIAAVLALALTPFVPPGIPVIAASAGALLGLLGPTGDEEELLAVEDHV
jgi:4-azaleucine resistance transporter AzlC